VKRSARLSVAPGLLVCAILLVTVVSACGDVEDKALAGTKWILTDYAVKGGIAGVEDGTVDATFTAPTNGRGEVSGNGGVNQYSGPYQVNGQNLTVGTLSSTRISGNPAAMRQETEYLAALQAAASYEIDGDTLHIKNQSGFTMVVYKAEH